MFALHASAVLGSTVCEEGLRKEEKSTTGAEVPCDGESTFLSFKQQCASGSTT